MPRRERSLERAFLGKGVARQAGALWALAHLHSNRGNIRSSNSSGSQDGELRKHFVVDLGDQVILAVGFAAPHLSELNGADCHGIFLTGAEVLPDYRGPRDPSIATKVTDGQG